MSRWLLERALLRDHVDELVGDLEERYAAKSRRIGERRAGWWYMREALQLCVTPALWRRPRLPRLAGLYYDLSADVRHAFRLVAREPVTSLAIVLTLAIGIGAVTIVFSAIDRFLVRLPDGIRAPDRVVEIYRRPLQEQHARGVGYEGYRVLTMSAFRTLRDANTLEASSLLSPGWPLSVAADGPSPERLDASFVSANFFDLLGAPIARGRGFDPVAEEAGASPVVVLSHAYWQRRFAADPGVLGRTLRVEGRDLTVIGVTGRGFVGTSVARAPDVWIPLSMIEVIPLWGERAATTGMFIGVARLQDGTTLAAAEAELALLSPLAFAEGHSAFRVTPLREVTVDPNRRGSFRGAGGVLLGGAALLLLIACLNVANVLLARSIRRQRELAVRVALGAGRARLARQLFIESALLYVLGGAGGILLLAGVRPWLGGLRPPSRFFFSNPALELPIDWRVLAFALAATGTCALVFGLLPAWRALRGDPGERLHPYGPTGSAPRELRLRDGLVVLQVAFCLVALAGAGLFLRGVAAARAVDPGFDARNLGMVSVNLHYAGYDRDQQHAYFRRAREAVSAHPDIEAAGFSWLRPLEFGPIYQILAYPNAPPEDRYPTRATAITPGYLDAAGVRLLAGRDFRDSDRSDSGTPPAEIPYVVIVNERVVELLWPGEPAENAIGRRIHGGFVAGSGAEIIGVVPTGRHISLGEEPTPAVFTSLEQMRSVPTGTLFFRTTAPLARALEQVAARLQQVDPAVPIHDIESAAALIHRALWSVRASAALLAAVATVGLLLAALGVYGVISNMVGERRRELGIRIALGAGRGRLYHLVIGRVCVVALAGIAIGVAGVATAGRIIAGMLYGVPPTDAPTLVAVTSALLVVAVVAAWLPARQATRVDPLEVLRGD